MQEDLRQLIKALLDKEKRQKDRLQKLGVEPEQSPILANSFITEYSK